MCWWQNTALLQKSWRWVLFVPNEKFLTFHSTRTCTNESGAFVKFWMKTETLLSLWSKYKHMSNAPTARKCSTILRYKAHFHCSKVIIICNIECTAKKRSLQVLLRLLELMLQVKVVVSFFSFTCFRCCCRSCTGTFSLARSERWKGVWHLLPCLFGRTLLGIGWNWQSKTHGLGFWTQ